MNIQEFKRQNPAYADVPDQKLADALYRKHYAKTGMTRLEFYDKAQVAITNPESAPKEGSSIGSVAEQVPSGIWRGIEGFADSVANMPFTAAQGAHDTLRTIINGRNALIGNDSRIPEADIVPAMRQGFDRAAGMIPGGSQVGEAAAQGKEYLMTPPREPQDATERVAARGAEIFGTALPAVLAPQALALRQPASYASSPATARTAIGQVGENMLKSTMNAPGRTAATELGYAALAGTGGGIGNEVGGPVGEAIGSMALPMAGAAATTFSPAFAAGRAVRALAPTVSEKAATSRARQMVGETLGQELPRYQQEVARSREVERAVNRGAEAAGSPDRMELSLAERTGSPAITAAQRDLERRMTGETLEEAYKRRVSQDRAVDAFAGGVAPRSALTPEDLASLARRRSDAVNIKIRDQQSQAALEREMLARRVPTADLVEQGGNIRAALDDRRKAVKAAFDVRAAEEGINSANVTLDFWQFQKHIKDAYAPRTFDNPAYRPKVLDAITSFGTEGGRQPVTFQDVKGLRERIVDDLMVAQRSSNPTEKMREASLSRLLRDFDSFITDAELQNASPALAQKWRNYRRDYKALYLEPFRQPDIRGYSARDVEGFKKMSAEAVAADLVKPGNVRAIRAYKSALEAMEPMTPEHLRGLEAVEAVALDSLAKYAVRDGVIDPARMAAWRRENAVLLEELPFVQGTVADIAEANTRLLNRQRTLTSRAKMVERATLERKLSQIEAGSKSADSLIDDAVKNPAIAQRLRSRLRNDPAALNGLRASVWERIPLDDPANTRAFLERYGKSLDAVFTPQHMKNVRFIADAREMADRIPVPEGAGPEQVPFRGVEDKLGMSVPSLGAALRTIHTGRTTPFFEGPRVGLNWLRARSKRQLDELWQQALYDPEVAADLAAVIRNPDRLTVQRLMGKTFRFGIGIEPDRPNAWVTGPMFASGQDERQRYMPRKGQ
jgi:hypothetical protein